MAIDPAIRRRLVPVYIPPPTTDAVKVWLAEEPQIVTEAMKVLGKEQVGIDLATHLGDCPAT